MRSTKDIEIIETFKKNLYIDYIFNNFLFYILLYVLLLECGNTKLSFLDIF